MSDMIQVECKGCGGDMFIVPVAGTIAGVCEACIEKEHKSKTQAHGYVDRRQTWEKLTENFRRYMSTDWFKLPCQYSSDRAMAWKSDSGTSLNLWGMPRTGKTRTMIEVLRREHDYGKTFRVFGPADFALALASFGFKADNWIAKIRQADIIGFDDVDKLRLSPVQEGHFFSLVEHFIAKQKPLIFTHNSTSESLKGRFRNGEALVGRMRDPSLFKSIHFNLQPINNFASLPASDRDI